MKYKLSKEESLILSLFVEREVPDFICEIVIDNINLSEHYEELFTSLDKGTQPFVVCDG